MTTPGKQNPAPPSAPAPTDEQTGKPWTIIQVAGTDLFRLYGSSLLATFHYGELGVFERIQAAHNTSLLPVKEEKGEVALEPPGGNVYHPHPMLINSGTFWRCKHGNTGLKTLWDWVGCDECAKEDPEAYARFHKSSTTEALVASKAGDGQTQNTPPLRPLQQSAERFFKFLRVAEAILAGSEHGSIRWHGPDANNQWCWQYRNVKDIAIILSENFSDNQPVAPVTPSPAPTVTPSETEEEIAGRAVIQLRSQAAIHDKHNLQVIVSAIRKAKAQAQVTQGEEWRALEYPLVEDPCRNASLRCGNDVIIATLPIKDALHAAQKHNSAMVSLTLGESADAWASREYLEEVSKRIGRAYNCDWFRAYQILICAFPPSSAVLGGEEKKETCEVCQGGRIINGQGGSRPCPACSPFSLGIPEAPVDHAQAVLRKNEQR